MLIRTIDTWNNYRNARKCGCNCAPRWTASTIRARGGARVFENRALGVNSVIGSAGNVAAPLFRPAVVVIVNFPRNIELRDESPRRLARRLRRAARATTLSVNPTHPPPSASAYRGRYPIPINFNDERGQFNTRRQSL